MINIFALKSKIRFLEIGRVTGINSAGITLIISRVIIRRVSITTTLRGPVATTIRGATAIRRGA